jgi:hypothetical protein
LVALRQGSTRIDDRFSARNLTNLQLPLILNKLNGGKQKALLNN